MTSKKTLQIGRLPTNEIVIDEPMISGNHAVLRFTNEGIVLEDLGSTNGTAVGDSENPISSAAVEPTDVVYFGSYTVSVQELIEMADRPLTARSLGPAAIVSGVAVILLAIGFLLSRGSSEPAPGERVAASNGSSGENAIADSSIPNVDAGTAPTVEKKNASPIGKVVENPGTLLYSIVIDPTGSEVGVRLGMAWPVDRSTLVTTGSIALFLKRHTDKYLQASVRNESTGEEFPILRAVPHPDFEHFQGEATALRTKADQLRLQIESAAAAEIPPTEADFTKLVDEAVKAESQWFGLTERQTDSDVGLVSGTGRDETESLTFVASVPEAGQKLRILGTPFTTESCVVEPDLPLPVQSPSGKAILIKSRRGLTSNRRIAIDLPEALVAYQWAGSPVVDATNSVVGVVVRRSPPSVSGDDVPPNRFDILLTTTLSDFIAEFQKP